MYLLWNKPPNIPECMQMNLKKASPSVTTATSFFSAVAAIVPEKPEVHGKNSVPLQKRTILLQKKPLIGQRKTVCLWTKFLI